MTGAPAGAAPPDEEDDPPPGRLEAALAAGTLAAIATGGALLGFGWREGEPGRMFRLAGRTLLERAGVASGALPLTAVALGYVHHLLVASAWGTLLALCVVPWRGAWRIPAAIAAAAAYGWLAAGRLPVPLRIGLAVTEQPGAVVSIAASLAVALLGGAWLARRADPRPGVP
ncbi:MAG: hypothetical protein KJT01_08890 [Gemmatimonadetes bacterium]|nr:hypothetical protein [Gemmatimonadota bacterium]